MSAAPFLSVVVPALNEEGCIASFIDRMRRELTGLVPSWEIVVVDDGSRDRTATIVADEAARDGRVRLISGAHQGKGAALRQGLLAATGDWRFMADADLAMPPDNLARFLAVIDGPDRPQIVIGSREAPGAERIGESVARHAIGRVFNWTVRLVALPGIHDTQCGFKLFSRAAVEDLLPRLTVPGFAMDVELLFLARRAGLPLREVGIIWRGRDDSRVAFGRGAEAFLDVVRMRWRWRNPHRFRAYLLALALTAGLAYDLLHMPVQVYDSLSEILDAERYRSVGAAFRESLGTSAYLRPLRIAQIKAVFDLSGGHYWAAYRGFHVLLLALCTWLFIRALRVRSPVDLAAAAVALTVLTGMATFRGTVQEAFPINHFLEMAVASLAALNLAQSRGGWRIDVAAACLFAAAALTLESGLLVWVVIVAARLAGLRGISTRGVVFVSALVAGYFSLRFGWLHTGTPGLSERSSGFLLSVLEADELERRFGAWPYPFYAYNVLASISAVLFSEPQSGVFVAVRSWLQGDVPPRVVLALLSALPTTALIVWAVAARLRASRVRTGGTAEPHAASLTAVAMAVILASALLSYAYTKDEIMSTAGVFYALAAFEAVRAALARASTARPAIAAAITAVLLVSGSAWAIRSAGLHHVLRLQAFRHRGDWALLPARFAGEGRPYEHDPGAAVVRRLRDQALAMPAPNPRFHARWAEGVWGD